MDFIIAKGGIRFKGVALTPFEVKVLDLITTSRLSEKRAIRKLLKDASTI